MASRFIRTLLSVAIYVLIAIAVLLAVRQVLIFSARIDHMAFFSAFDSFVGHLVIPFGMRAIKTPYGGVFSLDNALTCLLAIGAEWLLSGVRDRA